MQTRIVAYDRLGDIRGIVPAPLELTTTIGLNELATVSLHYAVNAPKNSYLDNEPELAIQTLINGVWEEIPNTRVRHLTVDFDRLEEVPTRRYDFIGVGEALKGVLVYKAYGKKLNDEGKVQFTNQTVGQIIKWIWDNAENRGWMGFDYSFTDAQDSTGADWNKRFSISYGVEANLLNILQGLVAMGVVDFEWSGRTLHLYNAHTAMARDQTLWTDPTRFAGSGGSTGIDSAPEMLDVGNLATHVIVIGENGLRWEFDTSTIVPENRRELILTFSGVDDQATAAVLAAPHILKSQNHLKNTTRQFHITPETKKLPIRDYMVGDWVQVQRGTVFERMRIFSLNIQINEHGVQGYVMLGDKIDDLLERMYQRIQGLTGGIANEGTGPVKKPPVRFPSAPYGVNVTTSSFISQAGSTQGLIGINFSHNGKDTAGENIDIGKYQVYYRPTNTTELWLPLIEITAPAQAGSYGPLPVYNEFRQLIYYDFYVTAISTAGRESVPSAVFTVQMKPDTEAPFEPTPPSVSTWLRTITVRWDGKGLTPSGVVVDMPADFNVVKVWQGNAPDMAGAVKVGEIRQQGLWQSNSMVAGQTYWYAFTAVDWTGNASEMTPSISVTPVANVDITLITDKINGAILDNDSINYQKLFASEEMWTRVLGAHKILAGEIDANSLTADTAFIGELRSGILITNAVETSTLKADAITSKHTITGAVFQTSADVATGIKISPSLGFRAYDTGGNERVRITSSEAVFTGQVVTGFNPNLNAELNDNVFSARPGVQFNVGISGSTQPFITGWGTSGGWSGGTGILHMYSARTPGQTPTEIFLTKDGSFHVGTDTKNLWGADTQLELNYGSSFLQFVGNQTTLYGFDTYILQSANNIKLQADQVTAWGNFATTGSKNFIMDHPTKPGWQLLHGSTESPVSGVEYWGTDSVDPSGSTVITLPEYFEGLVKPDTTHVLVTGNGSMVSWTDVVQGEFTVSGTPGTEFAWLVKAERFGGDFELERIKTEFPTGE